MKDPGTYAWYIRVCGVGAALLPKVAGAGHVVLEEQDQAAYRIDAATVDQLGGDPRQDRGPWRGKVALVLKQLAD